MSISKDNILFIYRDGDADSLAVANLYKSTHDLADDQIISLPCSRTEVLPSETVFNEQVLNPLKTSIDSLSRNAWVVILGYNVPGGFRDGNDIISSVSRVSRIHHDFNKKLGNFLYNRASFKRFDSADADFALIVSRIDAPTRALAEKMITNAQLLHLQRQANGTFYLDPYAGLLGDAAIKYQDKILDFSTKILPNLNLDIFSTVFLDPYIDVVIPSVTNDSFIWSWIADRNSLSFFQSTNALRVFCYNADFDGAFTIRDTTERRWPILAVQSGYISTAGAMSHPSFEGLLHPKPFFRTLLEGGTLGEAYLFSSPFVDWTMTFFGDPMPGVLFPAGQQEDTNVIDEDESWRLMSIDLGKAVAYLNRYDESVETVRDTVLQSEDVPTGVDLLLLSEQLRKSVGIDTIEADYTPVTRGLMEYITTRNKISPTLGNFAGIDKYLTQQGYRISELITRIVTPLTNISEDNISAAGSWVFEFVMQEEANAFVNYHFDLQISTDNLFNNIIFDIHSRTDRTNWSYEFDVDEFVPMESTGVPSSFVSRRIRYSSLLSQALDRISLYYVRVRQRDSNNVYDYRMFGEDIVFT